MPKNKKQRVDPQKAKKSEDFIKEVKKLLQKDDDVLTLTHVTGSRQNLTDLIDHIRKVCKTKYLVDEKWESKRTLHPDATDEEIYSSWGLQDLKTEKNELTQEPESPIRSNHSAFDFFSLLSDKFVMTIKALSPDDIVTISVLCHNYDKGRYTPHPFSSTGSVLEIIQQVAVNTDINGLMVIPLEDGGDTKNFYTNHGFKTSINSNILNWSSQGKQKKVFQEEKNTEGKTDKQKKTNSRKSGESSSQNDNPDERKHDKGPDEKNTSKVRKSDKQQPKGTQDEGSGSGRGKGGVGLG